MTSPESRTDQPDIAAASDPTPLRWGLNDVLWGDDDTVTVLLSGPAGEPYWLELDPERAAVLRQDLAGPDGDDEIAEIARPGEARRDLWPTIGGLCDWLDAENGRSDHEVAMRLLKIGEEAGEAAAAYIGWRGQNPRKGITHTQADVEAELCDVMVTADVALATISDDPETAFAAKLGKIAARAGVQATATTDADLLTVQQAIQCLAVQAANWPRGGAR